MNELEVTPENCFAAFQNLKRLELEKENERRKKLELDLNQRASEAIQEIDLILKQGKLPYDFKSSFKKVTQKVALHYSKLGWSCSMWDGRTYSYLTIDFPGPILRMWFKIKKLF